MKILAIGAHPDDIEIFMFGFLCCCKQMGYKISVIVATDGSLGGQNDDKKLVENSNLHDLFFHPGVENIFSGPGFLTVTKKDNFLWENIIQDLDS